jgi:hypothetical protein
VGFASAGGVKSHRTHPKIAGHVASTSVVDLKSRRRSRGFYEPKPADEKLLEHDFKLFGRHLPALAVRHKLEGHFVALAQLVETGTFDGADVNEGVLATVIRRNEAEALFGIKPFYGSLRHGNPFLETLQMLASAAADGRNRILEHDYCVALRSNFRKKLHQYFAYRHSQYKLF